MHEAPTELVFAPDEVARLLDESLAALTWALGKVPERLHATPPRHAPGKPAPWSVALNLAHMAVYEERLAGPVLADMAAGGDGSGAAPSGAEDWFERGAEDLSRELVAAIVARLHAARHGQIESVRRFTATHFNTPATPLWGGRQGPLQSAGWVAAKTIQHTWDHGNMVMQAALFHRDMFPG